MRDEFLDPQPVSETEIADDAGLRPRRLAEFVGQGELKEHLSIVLEAAKRRGQAMDHTNFGHGAPQRRQSVSGAASQKLRNAAGRRKGNG